jgi:hypothetical protein
MSELTEMIMLLLAMVPPSALGVYLLLKWARQRKETGQGQPGLLIGAVVCDVIVLALIVGYVLSR